MSERVVLFDVMDTLVHDPFRVEMPAFFGMTLAQMMQEKHPRAWIEFELAQRDEQSFLRDFFADGRTFDCEGFRDAVFGGYRLIEGIEPILHELRQTRVPMHAASNYPPWFRVIEERTQLSRFLAWTFVSCELGIRKPDPAYFEAVVARLGVSAEACIFVDDQPRNCDAARALGLDAIRFVDVISLRRALVERGLLVGSDRR